MSVEIVLVSNFVSSKSNKSKLTFQNFTSSHTFLISCRRQKITDQNTIKAEQWSSHLLSCTLHKFLRSFTLHNCLSNNPHEWKWLSRLAHDAINKQITTIATMARGASASVFYVTITFNNFSPRGSQRLTNLTVWSNNRKEKKTRNRMIFPLAIPF